MRIRRTLVLGTLAVVLVVAAGTAYAVSFNTPDATASTLQCDLVVPGGDVPGNEPSQGALRSLTQQYLALRSATGNAPNRLADRSESARRAAGAEHKPQTAAQRPKPAFQCMPIPTQWDARVIPIPTHWEDTEIVLVEAAK